MSNSTSLYIFCTGLSSIISCFIRPFDFSRAPLLRVGLIRIDQSSRHHILMIDIHHIMTDGVSMDILFKEIGALYTGSGLLPLKLRYRDFSEWQKSKEVKKEMGKQEAYWLKQYAGEIPVLELPTDFQRPLIQSFEGDRLQFNLDNKEISGLRDLAAGQGVTLFMLLCSLYYIFLSKISGQDDIIVGSPIAGRRHTDLEYVVGIFINTLALRNYPNGEKHFPEFLQEIKINTLDAYENQEYQYEDLVTRVPVKRDTGRNPLLDVMFSLNNVNMQFLDIPKFQIPDLKIAPYKSDFLISKVDMLLDVLDTAENISFILEYSTKLFKKETIWRFIGYFQQLVRVVLANPRQKISEIDIVTAEEKKKILFDFNENEIGYPKDNTIHQLFEEQVERTPDGTAVVGSKVAALRATSLQITYRQLNEQSAQLARLLIEKGVLANSIVGIIMERSIEMVIGIFGILKAGGAYLPVDPGYPQERIDYILKDSRAAILLTDNEKKKIANCQLSILNCQLLTSGAPR
ncbi:MAG TPA: condensation domain-containing protein, partial [Candidatus Kapabacteria bacterium]|nr:condensation domain-containing protein [Candidatus Kapabacteria bacterium]